MKEFDRFSFPRNYSGKVPLFFRKFPEKFRRKFPEISELTTLHSLIFWPVLIGNGFISTAMLRLLVSIYCEVYNLYCVFLWILLLEIFLDLRHLRCSILCWNLMHYGQHRDRQQQYVPKIKKTFVYWHFLRTFVLCHAPLTGLSRVRNLVFSTSLVAGWWRKLLLGVVSVGVA